MKKTTFACSVSFLFHIRVLSGEEGESQVRGGLEGEKVRRGGEGMEGHRERKDKETGDVEAGKNQREENAKYFKKINIWVISSLRGQSLPKG